MSRPTSKLLSALSRVTQSKNCPLSSEERGKGVAQISLRSTTVITNDNISIIVPNSDFVTSTVKNWSHGDPRVRIRLPMGVAYGTDAEKLRRAVLEVAAAHLKVLRDPAPELFFMGFGDNSLSFELGVWTSEMTEKSRRFRSELYYAMETKLRQCGIEVPFPQRDLYLRSGTFELQGPGGAAPEGALATAKG
jgi:small-conductance mechanosensitive channel